MKWILPLAGLLCWAPALFAQPAQQLENAVKTYNQTKADTGKPQPDYPAAERALFDCERLLNGVIKTGNEAEVATARYFLAVATLLRGELYFRPEFLDQSKGGNVLIGLVAEFERLEPSVFPFRYTFDGKSYIVQYDDFLYTRFQYFCEMTEVYYLRRDFEKGRRYALRALSLGENINNRLEFLVYDFLRKMDPSAADMIQFSKKQIQTYSELTESDMKYFQEQNGFARKAVFRCADQLLLRQKAPAGFDPTGAESVTIAQHLRVTGDMDSLAGVFYAQAIGRGFQFAGPQRWETLDLLNRYGFTADGRLLCDQIAGKTTAQACEDLEKLALYYPKFGETIKGKSFQKTAEKCREEVVRQAQAAARAAERAARRAQRNKVYLGAYVLRLVQRPQYIDFGGALNIPVGSRTMLELSYLKARNDQDYLIMERLRDAEGINDVSNPHWEGFYAHLGFKKMERGGGKSKTYTGFLLNYNQRNFQPQYSDIIDPASGVAVAQQLRFDPEMRAYGAMLNIGVMGFGKPFGLDYYLGFGGAYHQFDLKNDNYSPADYTFSNAFLGQRKAAFWSLQVRFGITVGLCL